jgi:hypothetical protein
METGMQVKKASVFALVALVSVFLSSCGGGGGSNSNRTPTFTIGGTVSGLAGTGLVLENNSGDDLSVGANGTFTFFTPRSPVAALTTSPFRPSLPHRRRPAW